MQTETDFCLDWLRRHAPESPVLRFTFRGDATPSSGARSDAPGRDAFLLKSARLEHARRVAAILRAGQ